MVRPKIDETPEQILRRKMIAVAIRSIRNAIGWSQSQLAQEVGLSPSSVTKLERASMRLNEEKTNEILEQFKTMGVSFSIKKNAVTVSIGKSVIEKLNWDDALNSKTKIPDLGLISISISKNDERVNQMPEIQIQLNIDGNWRTYTVTINNSQMIQSAMESLRSQFPTGRVRAIDEKGSLVDMIS